MKESLKKILNEMRGSTALKNLMDPARNARFEAGVPTVADQKIYDKAFVKKDMTDSGHQAAKLIAQAKLTPKNVENLSLKASEFIKSGIQSKKEMPEDPKSEDYRTRLSTVKEMTVAGVGGGAPDATSQGVFVWNKKGKGHKIRKSSPKLEEGFGGGFGGAAATNSGNSHQGYTGDFNQKIKNKIKELKKKDKEESLEESFNLFLESNAEQQALVKQALEELKNGNKEKAEELWAKANELGKELLNKEKK